MFDLAGATMKWFLILMPINETEKAAVFPTTFPTKEACMTMGTVLITEREFRCELHEQPTTIA